MDKNFFVKTAIKADTTYLTLINKLTVDICKLLGFDEETSKNISLAVDEAVTNTIKHAYMFDKSKTLEVEYSVKGNELSITIWHTGKPISPEKLVFPDMKEYLEKYKKGGLGIILMIKFTDSVEYGTKEKKHFCKLTKKIPD